ncbi:Zinc finger FYVE-type protein [Neofusicoccum parvum]|nr:Zinc finger FYVE-type protein [Neofusicoccum parvum]
MPRSIPQPRVLIVTFPIEYARHQQHFMSLDPVIAQEREFLRNLVGRIAALNPQILLVQRNVSGLALQYLEEANITVVHNVKPSVLNAVSRCLQIRMISSIDKLATDPSTLGQCQSFDVKTYVHGRYKKTYIYLSGCKKELGCTIVLRGADTTTLRKLKQITEFLCYVVYNLKLETCLMRDEFVLIPSSIEGLNDKPGKNLTAQGGEIAQPVALPESKSTSNKPTIQIQDESGGTPVDAQTDYEGSIDDVDLPQLNVQQQMQQQEQPLEQAQEQANAINTSGSQELAIPEDVPMPSFYGDMVEKHNTKILSASPFIRFIQPYLLTQAREQERRLAYLRRLRDQYNQIQDEEDEEQDPYEKFELVQPEMVHTVVQKASRQVRDFLHAVHDAEYDKAMHNYLTQKRQWEAYLAANSDLFDPFTHQKIAVLYSVVNSVTSTPCIGPEIISLEFYKEHDLDHGFAADCTLGQYVEDLCYTANQTCNANGCGKKMVDHHRHYIHGEGQMSVVVEKYPSKIRGLHNTMLMWSSCRVCGQETQTIPMSESTWKYSFAKYLELTFWSTNLHPRADICPHDIHRNHVRYFGFNNIALRIQFDPIELYDVIVPRPTIAWKVDRDLKLKNEQFSRIEDRLDKFMASVKARIKSIRVDSVVPEKHEACKAEIANLMKRANDEQDFLRRKLQDKYMCSRYYEIIPLNRAIRAIHEKALAWDETFAKFEKAFFPSEKDIQRLAVLQLKKIFLDRDESQSQENSIEEGVEEAPAVLDGGQQSEKDGEKMTSPTPSGMSPEQARNMLASVVEQDHNEKDAEKAEAEGQETPHAVQDPEALANDAAQIAPAMDQSDAVELKPRAANTRDGSIQDFHCLDLYRCLSGTFNPLHHHSDVEGETSDVEHILEDIGIPDISDDSQILPPMDSSMDLSVDLPKHEKSFMMKMLNNFWSERSASGWTPLDYPFAPIEHVWEDSDIIVREDEPSSIIALALSNADYLGKLQEFRTEVGECGDAGSENMAHSEEANIEHNLRHKSNTNIKYVFQNRSVRATSDRFVESMSRCLKWDSKGGKTKSLFLKTLDDRFVLKSLSQIEVSAFLKFAPDYFSFIHQNLFSSLPSVIAKMFGLFQVTIKNPASGRDFDCFMLVMENLFYDRGNDLRRFDLKGSMRNRKIQSTGEQDEVLLDENLVDIIFEKPIFVREHTKKTLTLSVYNDTLFLSKQNVMDYSLMAGFNDSNREIVVGIIDCIRTYTWDKKLETWIKDRGKNKPTVTSPKDYRQRFRVAMSSYILQAPDFWHAFNTSAPSGGVGAAPQQQQIQSKAGNKLYTNGDGSGEQLQSPDGTMIGGLERRIVEADLPTGTEAEMGLGGMMAEMR